MPVAPVDIAEHSHTNDAGNGDIEIDRLSKVDLRWFQQQLKTFFVKCYCHNNDKQLAVPAQAQTNRRSCWLASV